MDHKDHVDLLRPAHLPPGGTYADLGAGNGAFTLALRELVGADAQIFAVDKDKSALNELQDEFIARFKSTLNLTLIPMDFSRPLSLPILDGIVMANSLHFFRDREKILRHAREYLKPDGALVLVEYNVDSGNLWVPHPLSFDTFKKLAPHAGFTEPRLLERVPSRFLREFYSAVAYRVE